MATGPNQGPRPAPRVVVRQIEGRMVLVNLGDNWIHELNPTGARIWELLAAGHDIDQIAEQLLAEFDPPADADIAAEVERIIAELLDKGLLEQ